MKKARPSVLLAGSAAARPATLRRWLARRGCQCQFAASFRDACHLLTQKEFDLVLCQYDLPDRTGLPLLDWLEGSHSSLVFSTAGKRGNRWLPVIERGERALDSSWVQTANLPGVLGNMLHNESGSVPS